MKLNKNGWGTVEMFLLSGGLLIALLVAVFFISQFYNSFNKKTNNNEYVSLENKIESAAKNYIEDNNVFVNGEEVITLSMLKENNYIDEIVDDEGNYCNGYVIVINNSNLYEYNGYILCNNYKTEKH